MTDYEYWHGKNELKPMYREVDRLWKQRRNEELWLQGLYIYNAFGSILKGLNGRADPYVKKPYDIIPKTEKVVEQEAKATAEDGREKLLTWLKANSTPKKKEVNNDG